MENNYEGILESVPTLQNLMSNERTIAHLGKFRVSKNEAKSKIS